MPYCSVDRPRLSLGPSFIPPFFPLGSICHFLSRGPITETPDHPPRQPPKHHTLFLTASLTSYGIACPPMILILTSSILFVFRARGIIFMGVTPSPPDGLPVSGVMPRTTALQILSCGCYEHQRQRTRFRSREWNAGTPAPNRACFRICGARPRDR